MNIPWNGLLKHGLNTDYRNWYLGDWATPTGIDQTNPLSVDAVDTVLYRFAIKRCVR